MATLSKGPDGNPRALIDAAPALARAAGQFQKVAYPGAVDLVTRELVRILSGRMSDCRICRNLRLNAAIERGFDESMADQLEHFETSDLSARQKAALRLATAFLTSPSDFDHAARSALLENFSTEEIAELLLDLIRYRPGSKLAVVTGMESDVEELVYA